MNYNEKAEELFTILITRKKYLKEIPFNFSQGENGALLYLNFVKDNVTITELTEVLGVSLPRVVSIINSLETKKLISKNPDSNDKRKVLITITEKGKKLILNQKQKSIKKIATVIQGLTEEEIIQYIEITKKMGKIEEMQEE